MKKKAGMYVMYIHAVSFVNHKRHSSSTGKSPIGLKLNSKDLYAIKVTIRIHHFAFFLNC